MENQEERNDSQPVNTAESPTLVSIEAINAEKQRLLEEKASLELEKTKAEVELLKQEITKYKFPEEVRAELPPKQQVDPIKNIEDNFKKLAYAIENYSVGHPERSPFTLTDSFNGENLLQGFGKWTQGEKVEDIFRNPLKNGV